VEGSQQGRGGQAHAVGDPLRPCSRHEVLRALNAYCKGFADDVPGFRHPEEGGVLAFNLHGPCGDEVYSGATVRAEGREGLPWGEEAILELGCEVVQEAIVAILEHYSRLQRLPELQVRRCIRYTGRKGL